MEMTTNTRAPISDIPNVSFNHGSTPFEQEMVLITKQESIHLTTQINYWRSQHSKAKEKIRNLEQQIHYKEGQIKDLRKRLFGKQSEKQSSPKSEKNNSANPSNRSRGQQKNSVGHGRTDRPDLPVTHERHDLR